MNYKELLAKGERVQDAALKSGLSGPGRVHDLRVRLDASSPGESKSGGEDWTITAGYADSPFGRCLVGECPRGICHLSFVESADGAAEWTELRKQWPRARVRRDDSAAARLTGRVFERSVRRRRRSALRAYVRGTAFQVRVWRALLRVGPGTLVSYGRLAAALNKPTAARAVGAAVARNPLAYLVPCHRVIRETGALGGYRWGQFRKRAMIDWESGQ